jgi:predicted AAA+ superfamily ATPase
MLLEQVEFFWQRDLGIERDQLAEVARAAAVPHAVIVSGLRRVGKSTCWLKWLISWEKTASITSTLKTIAF